jgi:hypothetical protein
MASAVLRRGNRGVSPLIEVIVAGSIGPTGAKRASGKAHGLAGNRRIVADIAAMMISVNPPFPLHRRCGVVSDPHHDHFASFVN